MLLEEILNNIWEDVYTDSIGNILSEAAVRQFKREGKNIIRRYRCTTGPKKGKMVSHPGDCSKRKDPKKVRQGRKVMRSKKNTIARKSAITKRTSISKIVAKMNARIMGRLPKTTTDKPKSKT